MKLLEVALQVRQDVFKLGLVTLAFTHQPLDTGEFLLDDLAFLGDKLEVGLLFDDLRFLLVHLLHEVLLALGLLVLDLAHGY